ncbi:DUF1538 domain-containing protein [Pannonibacter phragmitetus]|uniref:DUF1538 domain-containing protein n=1 Tax=Pannonibacter phragmitetus TaxID=121719 RepID=UPI000F0425AB|nr:DUF1538 domain-containing protein [Pannonibacter phragmitetus]
MTAVTGLLIDSFWQTALDVLPIAVVVGAFQLLAFRSVPPNLGRILVGVAAIIAGISFFRAGLNLSLVPMGDDLALRLAQRVASPEHSTFLNALWLVTFAASLGLAATMIEPTLTGIAQRVQDLTGGGLHPFSFRLVVAIGVAAGLALGTIRILVGFPYIYLLVPLLVLIAVAAIMAPRSFVPLALDSGPMATSVVTVPIIAAFGASLARHLPGRDPLADGFGLVLLALLAPIGCLLVFAQVRLILGRRRKGGD